MSPGTGAERKASLMGTSTGIGALTFACAAGSSTTALYGVPSTTSPFALGTVIGLSGINAGQRRTIWGFVSGVDLTFAGGADIGGEVEGEEIPLAGGERVERRRQMHDQ